MESSVVAPKPPAGRGAPSTDKKTIRGGDSAAKGRESDGNGQGNVPKSGNDPSMLGKAATPGSDSKTIASVLGEIVWLLTQSPKHKTFFLSDLEWMVMTPVLLNQVRIFYGDDRPLGVALWAYVDDEVEARLAAGNAKMKLQDWKSGDKPWLVDLIAPYGGFDEMIADLKSNVFPNKQISFLTAGSDGIEIKTV